MRFDKAIMMAMTITMITMKTMTMTLLREVMGEENIEALPVDKLPPPKVPLQVVIAVISSIKRDTNLLRDYLGIFPNPKSSSSSCLTGGRAHRGCSGKFGRFSSKLSLACSKAGEHLHLDLHHPTTRMLQIRWFLFAHYFYQSKA